MKEQRHYPTSLNTCPNSHYSRLSVYEWVVIKCLLSLVFQWKESKRRSLFFLLLSLFPFLSLPPPHSLLLSLSLFSFLFLSLFEEHFVKYFIMLRFESIKKPNLIKLEILQVCPNEELFILTSIAEWHFFTYQNLTHSWQQQIFRDNIFNLFIVNI